MASWILIHLLSAAFNLIAFPSSTALTGGEQSLCGTLDGPLQVSFF